MDEKPKNHYFDNDKVEKLLIEYVKSGCTDIKLRDAIMGHATQLIRMVIRTHNLHNIYPGRDESAFNDLFQIAWMQIEKTLYKFDCSPGHTKLFNYWCLSPDTKIITDQGIENLDELSRRDGGMILGPHGMVKVLNTASSEHKTAIKIKTMYGFELIGSSQHRLPVLRDGIIQIAEIGSITTNDHLGLLYNTNQFIGNDNIDDINIESDNRSQWQPPSTINQELAYILGLYISKGNFNNNTFNIYNTDHDVINTLCNNKLGLKFIWNNKHAVTSCHNVAFNELLTKLGFDQNAKSNNKIIPARLLRCSKNVIIAMIKGMMDGNGHTSKHNGCVGYTSTSKTLIDQLRMLFLNLGIISKLSTDNKLKYHPITRYQLSLSTIDSIKYYELIGFNIGRKLKQDNLKPTKDICYGITQLGRKISKKYKLWKQAHFRSKASKTAWSKLIKLYNSLNKLNIINDDDIITLRTIVEQRIKPINNIAWLPVTSITEMPGGKLYDIEIDSEDHLFSANGLLSRNSQVSRTVMLAHIKKESRDRRGKNALENHLITKPSSRPILVDRFLKEAREVCKYNNEYLELLNHIEDIYENDDRAYEGLIGKLIKRSGKSRQKIHNFLAFIRIRSIEFSDSPTNEQIQQKIIPTVENNNDE